MKLSNVSIDPTPTPLWRHIFPRINASDFAGFAPPVALALIALYGFSDCAVSDDGGGIPQHNGSHLFELRYVRVH